MTAILPFLAAGGSGDATSWEGSDAPVWDAERSRTAAGVGLWSWNVDTDEVAFDALPAALPRILAPGAPGLATVVRYD